MFSTSQFGVAPLKMLNSHMWLAAAKSDHSVTGSLMRWKMISDNARTPGLTEEEVEAVSPK